MFAAPRFIAVDDKPEHLVAILETFRLLGTSCMGLQFDSAVPFERTAFRGVRALFLDLHLITGVKTTDEKQHFANIASILETNISETGGPFILILWTEHAHLAQSLSDYLDTSLDTERPWCRPLAIIPLAKEKFINVASGATTAADDLRSAVDAALTASPQLAALIGWETDVLVAAGETLSSLTALVPASDRTTQGFATGLDAVLSRLAVEAVGKKHVGDDPRAAISSVLAPILADRIANQKITGTMATIWNQAITRHGDKLLPQATAAEAGSINRMLHVAVLQSENIRPSDWGAVSNIPAEYWTDAALKELIGVGIDHLLREEFKIQRKDHSLCRPRLVRIGAVCDHAQKRPGPIPFLFAIEIPKSVNRIETKGELRVSAAEWQSPIFNLTDSPEPFTLYVNSRFEITRPEAATASWRAVYRLREQLLMQLIGHAGTYAGRPGIVRLDHQKAANQAPYRD